MVAQLIKLDLGEKVSAESAAPNSGTSREPNTSVSVSNASLSDGDLGAAKDLRSAGQRENAAPDVLTDLVDTAVTAAEHAHHHSHENKHDRLRHDGLEGATGVVGQLLAAAKSGLIPTSGNGLDEQQLALFLGTKKRSTGIAELDRFLESNPLMQSFAAVLQQQLARVQLEKGAKSGAADVLASPDALKAAVDIIVTLREGQPLSAETYVGDMGEKRYREEIAAAAARFVGGEGTEGLQRLAKEVFLEPLSLQQDLARLQLDAVRLGTQRGKLLAGVSGVKGELDRVELEIEELRQKIDEVQAPLFRMYLEATLGHAEKIARSELVLKNVLVLQQDAVLTEGTAQGATKLEALNLYLHEQAIFIASNPRFSEVLEERREQVVRESQSMRVRCEESARMLYVACDGAGTDENGIFNALEGKSAQELALIETFYRANYEDLTLHQLIDGELNGPLTSQEDLDRALAALAPLKGYDTSAADAFRSISAATYKLEGEKIFDLPSAAAIAQVSAGENQAEWWALEAQLENAGRTVGSDIGALTQKIIDARNEGGVSLVALEQANRKLGGNSFLGQILSVVTPFNQQPQRKTATEWATTIHSVALRDFSAQSVIAVADLYVQANDQGVSFAEIEAEALKQGSRPIFDIIRGRTIDPKDPNAPSEEHYSRARVVLGLVSERDDIALSGVSAVTFNELETLAHSQAMLKVQVNSGNDPRQARYETETELRRDLLANLEVNEQTTGAMIARAELDALRLEVMKSSEEVGFLSSYTLAKDKEIFSKRLKDAEDKLAIVKRVYHQTREAVAQAYQGLGEEFDQDLSKFDAVEKLVERGKNEGVKKASALRAGLSDPSTIVHNLDPIDRERFAAMYRAVYGESVMCNETLYVGGTTFAKFIGDQDAEILAELKEGIDSGNAEKVTGVLTAARERGQHETLIREFEKRYLQEYSWSHGSEFTRESGPCSDFEHVVRTRDLIGSLGTARIMAVRQGDQEKLDVFAFADVLQKDSPAMFGENRSGLAVLEHLESLRTADGQLDLPRIRRLAVAYDQMMPTFYGREAVRGPGRRLELCLAELSTSGKEAVYSLLVAAQHATVKQDLEKAIVGAGSASNDPATRRSLDNIQAEIDRAVVEYKAAKFVLAAKSDNAEAARTVFVNPQLEELKIALEKSTNDFDPKYRTEASWEEEIEAIIKRHFPDGRIDHESKQFTAYVKDLAAAEIPEMVQLYIAIKTQQKQQNIAVEEAIKKRGGAGAEKSFTRAADKVLVASAREQGANSLAELFVHNAEGGGNPEQAKALLSQIPENAGERFKFEVQRTSGKSAEDIVAQVFPKELEHLTDLLKFKPPQTPEELFRAVEKRIEELDRGFDSFYSLMGFIPVIGKVNFAQEDCRAAAAEIEKLAREGCRDMAKFMPLYQRVVSMQMVHQQVRNVASDAVTGVVTKGIAVVTVFIPGANFVTICYVTAGTVVTEIALKKALSGDVSGDEVGRIVTRNAASLGAIRLLQVGAISRLNPVHALQNKMLETSGKMMLSSGRAVLPANAAQLGERAVLAQLGMQARILRSTWSPLTKFAGRGPIFSAPAAALMARAGSVVRGVGDGQIMGIAGAAADEIGSINNWRQGTALSGAAQAIRGSLMPTQMSVLEYAIFGSLGHGVASRSARRNAPIAPAQAQIEINNPSLSSAKRDYLRRTFEETGFITRQDLRDVRAGGFIRVGSALGGELGPRASQKLIARIDSEIAALQEKVAATPGDAQSALRLADIQAKRADFMGRLNEHNTLMVADRLGYERRAPPRVVAASAEDLRTHIEAHRNAIEASRNPAPAEGVPNEGSGGGSVKSTREKALAVLEKIRADTQALVDSIRNNPSALERAWAGISSSVNERLSASRARSNAESEVQSLTEEIVRIKKAVADGKYSSGEPIDADGVRILNENLAGLEARLRDARTVADPRPEAPRPATEAEELVARKKQIEIELSEVNERGERVLLDEPRRTALSAELTELTSRGERMIAAAEERGRIDNSGYSPELKAKMYEALELQVKENETHIRNGKASDYSEGLRERLAEVQRERRFEDLLRGTNGLEIEARLCRDIVGYEGELQAQREKLSPALTANERDAIVRQIEVISARLETAQRNLAQQVGVGRKTAEQLRKVDATVQDEGVRKAWREEIAHDHAVRLAERNNPNEVAAQSRNRDLARERRILEEVRYKAEESKRTIERTKREIEERHERAVKEAKQQGHSNEAANRARERADKQRALEMSRLERPADRDVQRQLEKEIRTLDRATQTEAKKALKDSVAQDKENGAQKKLEEARQKELTRIEGMGLRAKTLQRMRAAVNANFDLLQARQAKQTTREQIAALERVVELREQSLRRAERAESANARRQRAESRADRAIERQYQRGLRRVERSSSSERLKAELRERLEVRRQLARERGQDSAGIVKRDALRRQLGTLAQRIEQFKANDGRQRIIERAEQKYQKRVEAIKDNPGLSRAAKERFGRLALLERLKVGNEQIPNRALRKMVLRGLRQEIRHLERRESIRNRYLVEVQRINALAVPEQHRVVLRMKAGNTYRQELLGARPEAARLRWLDRMVFRRGQSTTENTRGSESRKVALIRARQAVLRIQAKEIRHRINLIERFGAELVLPQSVQVSAAEHHLQNVLRDIYGTSSVSARELGRAIREARGAQAKLRKLETALWSETAKTQRRLDRAAAKAEAKNDRYNKKLQRIERRAESVELKDLRRDYLRIERDVGEIAGSGRIQMQQRLNGARELLRLGEEIAARSAAERTQARRVRSTERRNQRISAQLTAKIKKISSKKTWSEERRAAEIELRTQQSELKKLRRSNDPASRQEANTRALEVARLKDRCADLAIRDRELFASAGTAEERNAVEHLVEVHRGYVNSMRAVRVGRKAGAPNLAELKARVTAAREQFLLAERNLFIIHSEAQMMLVRVRSLRSPEARAEVARAFELLVEAQTKPGLTAIERAAQQRVANRVIDTAISGDRSWYRKNQAVEKLAKREAKRLARIDNSKKSDFVKELKREQLGLESTIARNKVNGVTSDPEIARLIEVNEQLRIVKEYSAVERKAQRGRERFLARAERVGWLDEASMVRRRALAAVRTPTVRAFDPTALRKSREDSPLGRENDGPTQGEASDMNQPILNEEHALTRLRANQLQVVIDSMRSNGQQPNERVLGLLAELQARDASLTAQARQVAPVPPAAVVDSAVPGPRSVPAARSAPLPQLIEGVQIKEYLAAHPEAQGVVNEFFLSDRTTQTERLYLVEGRLEIGEIRDGVYRRRASNLDNPDSGGPDIDGGGFGGGGGSRPVSRGPQGVGGARRIPGSSSGDGAGADRPAPRIIGGGNAGQTGPSARSDRGGARAEISDVQGGDPRLGSIDIRGARGERGAPVEEVQMVVDESGAVAVADDLAGGVDPVDWWKAAAEPVETVLPPVSPRQQIGAEPSIARAPQQLAPQRTPQRLAERALVEELPVRERERIIELVEPLPEVELTPGRVQTSTSEQAIEAEMKAKDMSENQANAKIAPRTVIVPGTNDQTDPRTQPQAQRADEPAPQVAPAPQARMEPKPKTRPQQPEETGTGMAGQAKPKTEDPRLAEDERKLKILLEFYHAWEQHTSKHIGRKMREKGRAFLGTVEAWEGEFDSIRDEGMSG